MLCKTNNSCECRIERGGFFDISSRKENQKLFDRIRKNVHDEVREDPWRPDPGLRDISHLQIVHVRQLFGSQTSERQRLVVFAQIG